MKASHVLECVCSFFLSTLDEEMNISKSGIDMAGQESFLLLWNGGPLILIAESVAMVAGKGKQLLVLVVCSVCQPTNCIVRSFTFVGVHVNHIYTITLQ